jgi:hypothetical protein
MMMMMMMTTTTTVFFTSQKTPADLINRIVDASEVTTLPGDAMTTPKF